MVTFLSLPPETLFLTLQSCNSLSQAITLASTCKRLHSLYSSNMHSILCQVGPRDIPALGDALMAVSFSTFYCLSEQVVKMSQARATRIVVDHFHKGQLPPNPFPTRFTERGRSQSIL